MHYNNTPVHTCVIAMSTAKLVELGNELLFQIWKEPSKEVIAAREKVWKYMTFRKRIFLMCKRNYLHFSKILILFLFYAKHISNRPHQTRLYMYIQSSKKNPLFNAANFHMWIAKIEIHFRSVWLLVMKSGSFMITSSEKVVVGSRWWPNQWRSGSFYNVFANIDEESSTLTYTPINKHLIQTCTVNN